MTLTAGLRIKENKEVYEGEVTELTPEETENQVDNLAACLSSSSTFWLSQSTCIATQAIPQAAAPILLALS